MATLVVFGGAADGRLRSANADYATARAGGTLTADTTGTLYAGQTIIAGTYYIYEAFVNFDTSGVPDAATVDSVTLQAWIASNSSTTEFTVEARLYDWGATVTTADWIAGANLGDNTLLASVDTTGYTTGFMTFAENGTSFSSNISKTGTTSLMLCSARHRDGTTPTGDEYMQFSSADAAGTSQDPKLVIQYHVDTPATYYSSTADSYIRSVNAAYATARAGGTLTTFDAALTFGNVGQYKSTDYYVYEMFLSFNTADLADTATINAVTLSLNGTADLSTTDFIIQARIKDWGAAVTDADWVAGADLGALTLVATYNTANGWAQAGSTRAYFAENGTNFQSNLSLTGVTYLLLCSDRTADNTTPTGNEYVIANFADAAGTTSDPMLVVDYTIPSDDAPWTPLPPVVPGDDGEVVSLGEIDGGGSGVLAGLSIMLYDNNLTSPRLVEQFLERRLTGKRFTTRLPGGFDTFNASLECGPHEAMSWLFNYPLHRVVISDGYVTAWEGRIEDIHRKPHGVDITALGYTSSLYDRIFFEDSVYTTGTNYVEDVIRDILFTVCPQISTDYTHFGTTGVDVTPAIYDNRDYAGKIINDLLGLCQAEKWYYAVWADRVFWLFARSKSVIHWRTFLSDFEDYDIAWSVENLRNSVAVHYTSSGTPGDTAWSTDADSVRRFGITREEWPDAGNVGLPAATAMRDQRLAWGKYMQTVGRLTIKDTIRNMQGVPVPVWAVRAGTVMQIQDLSPGFDRLAAAEDPRRLFILQTEYDMESKQLTIIPETPERKL